MRTRSNLLYLVTCLSLVLFFSCKKDDNPASTPPASNPPPPPTLFELVQGRWDVDVPFFGRKQEKSSHASFKNQEKLDIGAVTSVEFFSDSTCIITLNYYYGLVHTISVSDSITFNLDGLGPLTDIRTYGDSLSFSFTYYDIPMTVKAAKRPNIEVNENRKALLNTWKLTTEEDGATFYEENEIDGDFHMIISAAGSFVLQYPDYAESINWKWHPEEPDAIVTYAAGQDEANNNHYFKILELSNARLKVQEVFLEPVYEDDGTGNEVITGYEKVIVNSFVLTAK
ncbi:hypothetical protein [Agriterribacter sp.]|uniref:hypothetical protein n=1 Tax=Agriterribacter sp. TaxID=2821509 RepID=UPI002CB18BDA|nr:hypothetical protein [Agriterribacter sp.]HRO47779.1 hypothetical protein [Agriterribacter sp.]HRQ17988.1 hypothetical protein [Agriterribacter sp.]